MIQPTSARDVAGTSIAEGGLALDMSRLSDVTVDPDAKLVHAGPGCLLKDVDQATQEHGLATVLGFVSEVGVAGLTLDGGFGYLMRRFGWAVDNLTEVEIVTATARSAPPAVTSTPTCSGPCGEVELVEEALLAGVPVLAIDPKGDFGNRLLSFPDLEPADLQPWVGDGDPEELARTWREGLASWGIDAETGLARTRHPHDHARSIVSPR